MRIKEIKLNNGYKRFLDLTIQLGDHPKKIIALVGPNGSGKSSVFDGMLFLNHDHMTIGSTNRKGNDFHSMTGSPISSDSIEINFDTGENFIGVMHRKRLSGIGNTIFSYRNPYRFNSNLDIKQIQAVPDIRENNYGASSSVDLDDRMTLNYQRLNIYLNEYRKANELTDKAAIQHVLGQINSILSNCVGLILVDHGDIMAGKGTLYFTKENQPREFSFNVLSSGEKEVVDMLLDIYLRKDFFNETIYLFDEPELHLNTGIQKKVLIEIEKLIPDTCQIWIATHSIGFLNALQNDLNEKSEIIDFDGDFSSKAAVLEPMEKTRKNWQKIFSTALEDLTGLLSPSTIVYCEGKYEPNVEGGEQGLDAEIYNQIFSQTYPNILFVSSGGSTMPDKYASIALIVLNKAFKDVNLLLLKDMDIEREGKPTLPEWRTAFIQRNPNLHRMLRRKEIENYLFDFEILSKAYDISHDAYIAEIPNIMDDVKLKAGKLMEICGVTNQMNKEQFKKHLARFVTPDTHIYNDLEDLLFLHPIN